MSLVLRPDTEMSFDILSFIKPPNGRPCHMYNKVERLQAKTRCPLVARHYKCRHGVSGGSKGRNGERKKNRLESSSN